MSTQIQRHEQQRINAMFKNLLKIRQERGGVIFLCGALHAENLMRRFKEANLEDEVLYYFPHSPKRYDESMDDIEYLMNPTLRGHTHVLSEESVPSFSRKILEDVQSKMEYQGRGESTYSSRLLNRLFGVHFQVFSRAGYNADALLDKQQNPQANKVRARLNAAGIATRDISREGRDYLVVPNVNQTAVIESLRKLSQPPRMSVPLRQRFDSLAISASASTQ
jgi:hypothetical protein